MREEGSSSGGGGGGRWRIRVSRGQPEKKLKKKKKHAICVQDDYVFNDMLYVSFFPMRREKWQGIYGTIGPSFFLSSSRFRCAIFCVRFLFSSASNIGGSANGETTTKTMRRKWEERNFRAGIGQVLKTDGGKKEEFVCLSWR